ncbi:MAG: ribosome biogenesis GTPase Der [Desulfuromonas sp.]|uniref:ribosome biogenesis GTPase Der n=1 Tax=Desulfuromonas thiophila TaxID=57664 RepID=UPI0024A9F155|nr:ribosome biogenesis GTPase Der [Desulfuromonas thiophila]MDD3800690.1 ribosome biogenesis GTPase Der [Desulfuromonas thiophila]
MSVVAIVGRPNVGKSTLFNRLLGERKALVEDFPGVTRDRNYALVTRHAKPFTLIDTGGFEPASEDRMLVQMREQSQLAIEEADLVLFVLDGRAGLTPADEEVAALLRQSTKPVLYVVNKVDGPQQEQAAAEFYGLGIASFVAISAEHGQGINDLVNQICAQLPPAPRETAAADQVRLAVIGRPNVGKSSLVNRLLGAERVVANPEAGTTRDSIDSPFRYNGKDFLLIDTAGIRRKGRVSQKLEKYSVLQALKAMDRAHVVLLLIDAAEGITEQDLTVAGYAYERGRALVLVVNKWDAVAKDHRTLNQFTQQVRDQFKFLPFAPVLFVSALTGQRVAKIMETVEQVANEFNRKVSTAELNRVLQAAEAAHQPPIFQGKRVKLFYMTQTAVRPPSFVIFVNRQEGLHFSYRRYLANKIREPFGFLGCPIRIEYRDRVR